MAAINGTSHGWINEPVPVVAPGAAVRFLPGVDALVPGQVGLRGGGEVAELTLERSLACVFNKRQKVMRPDETEYPKMLVAF